MEGVLHKRVSASDQETRDRAERGSVVRGSARASVLALQNPLHLTAQRSIRSKSAWLIQVLDAVKLQSVSWWL